MSAFAIAQVLSRYAECYRTVHIDQLARHEGFSGAVIYRVETPSGFFALRQWPPNSLPLARICGLHRLLAHASQSGVTQVSVPVAALDGTTCVLAHDRYWQLEPWMPGTADFGNRPTDARLLGAIQCLARFHQASSMYRNEASNTPPQLDTWFYVRDGCASPAVVERLERINHWMAVDCERLHSAMTTVPRDEFFHLAKEFLALFERSAPRVAERLRNMAGKRFFVQPCLRDIWHDHVLFTGDEVTGLIDASACRSDHVAVDLSRLLGSLVGNDRRAWDLALDVYGKHRTLASADLDLVGVLDRSGVLLSGMTWLQRRYLQGVTFPHPRRVLARLEHFLSRLRAL